jgi:hypothetical protein
VDSLGVPRLVFYEWHWWPLRNDVKRRFISCFEQADTSGGCRRVDFHGAEPNRDRRVFLNDLLKETILVDGFADAIVVLSEIGHVLRDDLTLAVCRITGDILRQNGLMQPQPPRERCDMAGVDSVQAANSKSRE